jgi:hypothetical protein
VWKRRYGEWAKPAERCLACQADEGSTQFQPFGLASATLHGVDTNFDHGVNFRANFLWNKKKSLCVYQRPA